MTIAEKMLELLDEGWGRAVLRMFRTEGKVEYRCAVGIRLDASGMTEIWNEAAADEALRGDPVIAAMARIIREQYPEALRDYSSCAGDIAEDVLSRDINVVMIFNDRYAGPHDIRAVIEKTAAEGL